MNPTSLMPAGIAVDDVLAVSSALAAIFVVLALWHGLIVRDPLAERARTLARRRAALSEGRRMPRGHRMHGDLRESGISLMRRAVVGLNLIRGHQSRSIGERLARAGLRKRDALVVYLFAKATLPFLLGGGAFVMTALAGDPPAPGTRLVIICVAAISGLYGPDLYLRNVTDRRMQTMRKGMPDALDLLVICAEAGSSLDSAMTRVGREMAGSNAELADELSLAAIELGFLPRRQDALMNLVKRTGLDELRSLVNSLLQTERYGTPLAQSLRVLSAEFRDDRLMRAEEKAARLPALMTVPMITFIMPALFIVLGGPALLRVMDALSKM